MSYQLKRKRTGLSLIELTAVIAILGITALALIPNLSSTDTIKLELAADQVAQALRFARSEAIRTGEHHGVTISREIQRVKVIKWDLTTNPVSTESVPYHPLSKQGFEFDVEGLSLAPGILISNSEDIFLYTVIGRRHSLIFDPQGVPIWILGSDGSDYRLLEGIVELSAGEDQRSISVAPLTGRVTIQ